MRHFIWDTASSMDIGSVDLLSWASIVLSVLLTVGFWFYVAMLKGWTLPWQ